MPCNNSTITMPCALIVSNTNTKPKSIIKLITKETPSDSSDPSKITHPWKLQTKYYEADIQLMGLTSDIPRSDELNANIEALIVHMDSNKPSGLDDLKQWESIETDCDPDIKLLISNYCNNNTKITKPKALEWCLKRGYELIELYPTVVDEPADQDIIEEKVGVDRIIEALQAHVWSNLIMKDEKKAEQKDDGVVLGEVLTGEGSDDFTELFNQLHLMKDSIQSLPMRERKQCAEQMVTAFWQAIGGDEEEIADV